MDRGRGKRFPFLSRSHFSRTFDRSILSNVKVNAATPATVRATLDVGELAEVVQVSAGAEIVQTQSSALSTTVNVKQVSEIPLTSRNVLDFVPLLPGVNTRGGNRDSTIFGLPQSAINITYDGVNVQDNTLKTTDGFFTAIQPRLDAVEEATITTGAQGADSSGGGTVQIRFVTRSGTNELRGSAYHYYRHDKLNANTWFNERDGLPTPALKQNQPGFRVGGPIVIPGIWDGHNKGFFFVNYEEFRQPQDVTRNRTILHPRAELGMFPYNSAGGVSEIDLLALAAATGTQTSSRRSFSSALRSTFGQKLVNEFRVGYSGSPLFFYKELTPAMWGAGAVADQGGFQLDMNTALGITNAANAPTPSSRDATTMLLENTMNWLKGKHSLSLGGSFTQANIRLINQTLVPEVDFGIVPGDPANAMFTTANFPGASTADLTRAQNLYAVLTGRVSSVTGNARISEDSGEYTYLGAATQRARMRDIGLFVQDQWRVRQNLTINAGLRYELQLPFTALNDSYATATMADVCGVSGVAGVRVDAAVSADRRRDRRRQHLRQRAAGAVVAVVADRHPAIDRRADGRRGALRRHAQRRSVGDGVQLQRDQRDGKRLSERVPARTAESSGEHRGGTRRHVQLCGAGHGHIPTSDLPRLLRRPAVACRKRQRELLVGAVHEQHVHQPAGGAQPAAVRRGERARCGCGAPHERAARGPARELHRRQSRSARRREHDHERRRHALRRDGAGAEATHEQRHPVRHELHLRQGLGAESLLVPSAVAGSARQRR
jgi:hypothetical protein